MFRATDGANPLTDSRRWTSSADGGGGALGIYEEAASPPAASVAARNLVTSQYPQITAATDAGAGHVNNRIGRRRSARIWDQKVFNPIISIAARPSSAYGLPMVSPIS